MKKDIIDFTKSFSEYVSAGIPTGKALMLIKKSSRLSKNIVRVAGELADSISGGRSLSFALQTSSSLVFPEWYLSLVEISEQSGRLCETLLYISKMMVDARKAREKFLVSLAYPVFIALFALGASVVFVNVLGSSFFSGEALFLYKIRAWKSVGLSGLFLLAFVAALLAVSSRIMGKSGLCMILRAISFLSECNIPLLQAVDSAVPAVYGEKRLFKAFSGISARIRSGDSASEAFAACLDEAGFSFAARIISARLEVCQATGKNDAFKIAADALEERGAKIRSAFLACEQPILICACGIYFVMLLKDTLMPLVLGGMEMI